MKTIKHLLLFAIIAIPYVVLAQSTETRALSSFSKLKAGGSFETIIEKGNQESARIEAEGIDTKKVITEQKNNTLNLYLEKGEYRNIKIKVYITFKSLDELSQSGSGKLTCNSDLEANEFSLACSGSGGLNIKGKITAQHLNISVSGSGGSDVSSLQSDDLKMSVAGSGGLNIADGKTKDQHIVVAGSGGIRAFGLKAEKATISVAGSGSVDISVDESIEGRIAGSGNINYKGDANIISNSTAGSGRIRKV